MTVRPEPPCLWVVDDDRSVRFVLAQALRDAGYRVQAFDSGDAALAAARRNEPADLVFTDVRMPGLDGLGFLAELKQRRPLLPVIVMSAYTDVASTAGAFRGGAHEFLSKPFDLDDAVALAVRALPQIDPSQIDVLPVDAPPVDVPDPQPSGPQTSHDALVGHTPAMRELFRSIGRLAQAPLSVLILGETGTGKELVARALHRESPRARQPFVALNSAAIPAELLESELFGHEAGAFTGANRRHIGRFEQADGGTLFLDEIGDMPALLQTRLLRVLAEGEFFRVGGRELIRVDVRVIAATHQNLDAGAAEGRFRADLLHRLDVVRLRLPPLRERRADVPLLAERFLEQACHKLGVATKQLQPAAMVALQQQAWPGNVRELENVCWRLAALAPSERIGVRDLAVAFPQAPPERAAAHDWSDRLAAEVRAALARGEHDLHPTLREIFDRTVLEAALAHCEGHRQQAADRLGLGRNTLTRKLGSGRSPRAAVTRNRSDE